MMIRVWRDFFGAETLSSVFLTGFFAFFFAAAIRFRHNNISFAQVQEAVYSMILKIKSSGKIICKDLKEAKSLSDQLFGLIIKSNPRYMLFKTRFGIHTFFLKEPIDVLVLDKDYKIMHLRENVKPNSLVFWNPRYFNILELPKGTILKNKIRQTQTLQIC